MDRIAICGKMASGKSTLAKLLNAKMYSDKAVISSFAAPIKEIEANRSLLSDYADSDGKPLSACDRFINTLERLDAKTAKNAKHRRQYQFIGEEMRMMYGRDFWTKKFFRDFDQWSAAMSSVFTSPSALIIEDLRMMSEYEEIMSREEDFVLISVECPEEMRIRLILENNLGTIDSLDNSSETEIDSVIAEIKLSGIDRMYQFDSGRIVTVTSSKKCENDKREREKEKSIVWQVEKTIIDNYS